MADDRGKAPDTPAETLTRGTFTRGTLTRDPPDPVGDTLDASQLTPAELPHRDRSRYLVRGEHGRGGLGRVLTARDVELGRTVAVKELLSEDASARARFVREARITARLEHPAIVPIHEAGRWPDDGQPFYTMKLVSGRSLKEVVAEAEGLEDRLRLVGNVLAVADAVAYAHAEGVIHRDLKPSNVMVGGYGETVVIDWGLAKDLHAEEPDDLASVAPGIGGDVTVAGSVLGTPTFMPPEQARGDEVDERADVYAIGAMLYYVLCGEVPYRGANTAEVLERVRSEPPTPLRKKAPGAPTDLVSIVERAMARTPEQRYPSARELAEDLRRFRNGQLVTAHRYTGLERMSRWTRRHTGLVILSVLFVIAAAIGTGWFVTREARLRREAEAERDRAAAETRRAEAERVRADRQTRALLEQQGRQELARGRPSRAAVYLSEAYLRDPDSRALRWLTSEALSAIRGRRLRLRGHTRDVIDVAWSPDGNYLLTGSADETVRVWDAKTGDSLHVLPHGDELDCVVFGPESKHAATGAIDNVIRIWDVETGELVRTFEDDNPYRVRFSPEGDRIFSGGQDGSLRVRDAESGRLLFEERAHRNRLSRIAFSPDGSRFVTAGWDGVTVMWDATTYERLFEMRGHDKSVSSARFSQDGKWLVTVDSGVPVLVRDASTGEVKLRIRLPEGAHWSDAFFGPGGKTIITNSHDGVLRVWHASSGKLLRSIDAVVRGKLFQARLSPDRTEVLVAGHSGVADVWDLEVGATYRVLSRFPIGWEHSAYTGFWLREADRIVGGTSDGVVHVWEPSSRRELLGFEVPGITFNLTPTPDGRRVVVPGRGETRTKGTLWDATSGELVADLEGHESLVYTTGASPDGSIVATGSYDGTVRLWNAEDGSLIRILDGGDDEMTAIAFRPDSTDVAVTTGKGQLIIFDRDSGERRATVQAHTTWIQDVEYSRDGERLITSGRQDHTAHVWNADGVERRLTIAAHEDNMIRGEFGPDGDIIATSGMDHTAKLWDARTGDLLRTIPGPAYSADLSPDGTAMYTSGYKGYAVVWDLSPDERSAEEVATEVRELSPWRLRDGVLTLEAGVEEPDQ